MRRTLFTILASLAVVLPLAPPAAAGTDSGARERFEEIALEALNEVEEQLSLPECPDPLPGDLQSIDECWYGGDEAWVYAYLARLTAWRDGWDDPKVEDYLQKVYDRKIPGGYGKTRAWDAFQDGTENSQYVAYTVTMTDHVGEPLLEGYLHDAVPAHQIQYLFDNLWDIPTWNTRSGPDENGKCVSYSESTNDQPAALNDNRFWCVNNVSIGAAAFMQKLLNAGFTPSGVSAQTVQTKIEHFKDHGQNVYTPRPTPSEWGFWAYSYRSLDGEHSDNGKPQDLNHNAYTAESAYYLGMASGEPALKRMQDNTDFTIRDDKVDAADTHRTLEKWAHEIEGRLRAQSVYPGYQPQNMLTELDWYMGLSGWRTNTRWLQLGSWAARLADNAQAGAEDRRTIDFMSTPKLFQVGYDGDISDPNDQQVLAPQAGQNYRVIGDARWTTRDGSKEFVLGTPVELYIGVNGATPTLVDTKTTGFDHRGVQFIWDNNADPGDTVTFCMKAIQQDGSRYESNCRHRTVQ